jgi:hypothetical protein
MKLFNVSPDLLQSVKDVMEKKMSKEELAALGGDKEKVDAEDFEALRNGEHKKKKKKKHHVKEEEVLDERNKENKFKKDLNTVNKAIEFDKNNLGMTPDDLMKVSKDFGHDKDKTRDAMKSLIKSYKRTGRALAKEEAETVEEGRDPGSTWGVSTPLRQKGVAVSENGRHVAKIKRDRDWGEWRVELHSDGKHLKDADYHTDDKEEAHANAKAMVAHAQKHEKPLKEETSLVSKIINKYTK